MGQTAYQAVRDCSSTRRVQFSASPWGAKYPTIVQSWRRAWEQVIPFFVFPPEVRRIIYTTNVIESLYMQLRKIIKVIEDLIDALLSTQMTHTDLHHQPVSHVCVILCTSGTIKLPHPRISDCFLISLFPALLGHLLATLSSLLNFLRRWTPYVESSAPHGFSRYATCKKAEHQY
jgi:hypothetical protein